MKIYLHAVIVNFSRRILAWRLAERLDPLTTCEVLAEAGKAIGCVPTVVADSGVEDVNGQVDDLVRTGVLCRILSLVEVAFSNSMIEARLAIPAPPVAVPAYARQLGQCAAIDCLLHRTAQRRDATLGIPRPDAR